MYIQTYTFVKHSFRCVDENEESLNEIKIKLKKNKIRTKSSRFFVQDTNGKSIEKKALRNEPEIEQVPYVRE